MGTYTTLFLGDFELVQSKSFVIPEIMTVFSERDRRCRWDSIVDRNSVGGQSDDDAAVRKVDYAVRVDSAIQRLEIMGFSLAQSRLEYERLRQLELQNFVDTADGVEAFGGSLDKYDIEKLKELEDLIFDNYVAGFRQVFQLRSEQYRLTEEQREELIFPADYILHRDHEDWHFFGFFCTDVRMFLRMALSIAPPDMLLMQDISDLVSGAFIYEQDSIRDDAVRSLVERYPQNTPRIVLTEGSTDAEILRKSLEVLFPHLVGYYTFFDFHGSKAAGGATQLISVVKAFSAAGIANRVIAILDNDTAAHEALRALRDVRLPDNLVVVHYPSRDWLNEYPTLGPSGNVLLNVNGKAGGIELYLGRDVLTTDGELCPIQWAGYSQVMGAYQGELLDKNGVINRWRLKADHSLSARDSIVPADWEDLRAVWDQIMSAFSP